MSRFTDMMQELALAYKDEYGIDTVPEKTTRIQQRVIQQFGGLRIEIPTRRANFTVGEMRFDMTGGPRAVMERYSVSQRTAYRILRRR